MDPKEVNPVLPTPTIQSVPEVTPSDPNVQLKPIPPIPTDQSVFQEIPPKPKSKILLLLIIIIVLTGLGIVAYQVYQKYFISTNTVSAPEEVIPTAVVSIDPTADWTTLANENGFSIKYPSNLKVLGEGMEVNEINATDIIIAAKPGDPEDTSAALHINVAQKDYTVYKDMTLEEISKLNYEANQTNQNTFIRIIDPIKTTVFIGKPAYTYTIEAKAYSGKWSGWPVNASLAEPQNLTVIETENNGNYFIIVYSSDDQTIESVLSTFKFTE